MADARSRATVDWRSTWKDNRRSLLEASMAATPAQRLAWLEEALQLAYRSGALPDRSSTAAARRASDRLAE
ncbi:MAG: hypothetical protein GY719_04200 [bacterium]|nr:hypothetical protein [bacterium]